METAGRKAQAFRRFVLHDLRHTQATAPRRSQPAFIQELRRKRLGHSTIAITMDLSSHVLPNMQADAVATMDHALLKAGPAKD